MAGGDLDARDRLIVALDVPSVAEAREMVSALGPAVRFYKVGLELVMAGGLDVVRELRAGGARVFLDMKFLDIGNTVEKAVRRAAETGANFLTVHATDTKTLAAAAAGAEGSDLKILGVTVLTSLDARDLAEQRIDAASSEVVAHRAGLIAESGCHGVVASGQEAASVRDVVGPSKFIVTPGIRLASDSADDQKRVATPESAISDGADFLVVGRPITAAADPRAAAGRFVDAIRVAAQ
ncbi:MAG: orotidine-5'-phosphate decarboxylase [Pseudomonadota bacterium]